MLEKIDGYKTIAFFTLTLLVAIAKMFGFIDYTPNGNEAEIISIVLSIVGIALRYVTNKPIFNRPAE